MLVLCVSWAAFIVCVGQGKVVFPVITYSLQSNTNYKCTSPNERDQFGQVNMQGILISEQPPGKVSRSGTSAKGIVREAGRMQLH